jgi:hypothetical protein
MEKVVISFFYRGQVLHVLESGKVITNDGKSSSIHAKVVIRTDITGATWYEIHIYEGYEKIANMTTSH